MLNKKLQDAINDQIGHEFYSALQWFITEEVEEEKSIVEVITPPIAP